MTRLRLLSRCAAHVRFVRTVWTLSGSWLREGLRANLRRAALASLLLALVVIWPGLSALWCTPTQYVFPLFVGAAAVMLLVASLRQAWLHFSAMVRDAKRSYPHEMAGLRADEQAVVLEGGTINRPSSCERLRRL